VSSAFDDSDVRRGGMAADGSMLSALGAVELDPRGDFAAVYELHYRAVYRAVRGVVLDPGLAEDVTQDAFLKAYRARHRFRPTGRVEAWLCTIAVREAISRLRWTALQRRVLEASGRAGAPRPAAATGELLDELLSTLSPKARAVVVLHFLHGYRYREIATMLRLPEGTVASRLSQALAQMRRRATERDPQAGRRERAR
jgi:RNA polymerase sigma-70 factor (ECF subfamily)